MQYVVASYKDGQSNAAYTPYGAIREFFHYTGQECMLSGPYDTGKTLGMLQKLNALLWTYPGCHSLLVRKTYSSLLSSAVVTLYDKVYPVSPNDPESPIKPIGGNYPNKLIYPNGSVLRIAGLDDPQKVLSAEYDQIAVPQAEELNLEDWEQLLGRANGRAGNAPWPQVMGDCNPDVPLHWIQQRDELVKFEARHVDNPTLFQRDAKGQLVTDSNGNPVPTEGGKMRIRTLRSMTGLRYKRGYLGLWVGAEGQVYEDFDPKVHIIDPFPIPPDWRRFRSIDFGFVHPFVCQWWAEDEDGRLIMYREQYYSRRTVAMHAAGDGLTRGIVDYSQGEKYQATICDWDAEDRATLEEHGISTRRADKRIQVGIEKVQERLKVQDDGRPRIMIFRNALVEEDEDLKTAYKPTSTATEFSGYVWPKVAGKLQKSADERPIKTSDHGMDAMRYMVMHLDGGKGGTVRAHRYA